MLKLRRKKRKPTLKRLIANEIHCSKRRIKVGDRYLDPIAPKAMGEFLIADKTDELQWKKGVLECNTFALFFRAHAKRWFLDRGSNAAVGTIWTYATWTKVAHAFNFYLTPNMKVIFIEPQTDQERFLDARVDFVII